ncbi:MAG: hypothetical protein GXP41_07070 [Chloroflexi bacterium]|nr:hypothetical protein [Chloroflexota bacterium]
MHAHLPRSRRMWIALLVLIFAVAGSTLACQPKTPTPETHVPPKVAETTPPEGGTAVRQAGITIQFDQQMNRASVEQAFSIEPAVAGQFGWTQRDGQDALTFTPDTPLDWAATYRVTVAATAQNDKGLALAAPFQLTFQTGEKVAVVAASPKAGTSDVPLNSSLTVQFNTKMVQVTSLDEQTNLPQPLSLDPPVDGVGRWIAADQFRFFPSEGLRAGVDYHVTIAAAVAPGYEMDHTYGWQFTTEGPRILSTMPFTGATEVARSEPIAVLFNQPMDEETTAKSVQLRPAECAAPCPAVKGSTEWEEGRRLIFRPDEPLDEDTRYALEISTEAQAAGGHVGIHAPFRATFLTVDHLRVANVEPAAGSQHISTDPEDTRVAVQFNHPVVPLVGVAGQSGLPQPLTIEPALQGKGEWLNTSLFTFRPTEPLRPSTRYTITVAAGLTDTVGGTLTEAYAWSFTTTYPVVVRTTPAAKSKYVSPSTTITVTFNQPMDPVRLPDFFQLSGPAGDVQGTVEVSGTQFVFRPAQPLRRGATYQATISDGAPGAAGGEMAKAYTWPFTVASAPAILSTEPADGEQEANGNRGLRITFADPMKRTAFEDFVTFVPTVTNVYTYWHQSDTKLTMWATFKPSENYTVTISGDAVDRYGTPLGQDTVVRFRTAPRSPMASLRNTGRVGTYNAYTDTLAIVAHRNVSALNFFLYRLDRADLIRLTGENSYRAWEDYFPPNAGLVRTWTKPVTTALNVDGLTKTRVPPNPAESLAPGIYYLGIDTPEEGRATRQLMVVSRINLTFKRTETEALVWATDLKSGEVVPDLPITLFDEKGTMLAQGQTNSDGVFRTDFDKQDVWAPLYAFAADGPSFAAAVSTWDDGISAWDFGLSTQYHAEPHRANLYTDRPIYRPGQTVHFKGIIRRDHDARYELLTEVPKLDVSARDSMGKKIYTETLSLDEFGTIHGDLTLASEATTGNYYLSTKVSGRTYGVNFKVAEYRKPEYQVTVQADKDSYINGDTINVNVESSYYFGGAVADAPLRWRVLHEDYSFSPDLPGYWSFTDSDAMRDRYQGGGPELVSEGEGKTDSQGRFTFQVPADITEQGVSQQFTLEAEITDVNNQTVTRRTTVIVHKGAFYIGLRPTHYVGKANEPQTVELRTLDTEGQKLGGQKLTVRAYSRRWFSVKQKGDDGSFYWTTTVSDTFVSESQVTTDSDGKAEATFTPPKGGTYRVLATGKDERGNEVRADTYVWVSGRQFVSWRQENNDRIELVTDRKSYKPGDVAEILVPAPWAGATALLTIERGTIKEYRVITLETNSEVLRLPITAEYAPNVYFSLVLVKGMDEHTPLPETRVGMANLPVSTEQQELNIAVAADRTPAEYKPGDTVTYTLKATDFAGKPQRAELSVALVDKAITALASEQARTLMDTFYGERGTSVRTASSLIVSVDRVSQRLAPTSKGGGGGGPGGAVVVRQNFVDTAYWNPTLTTDAQGETHFSVELPDNLTTWQLTAKGVTAKTLVGQQKHEIVATKDLLVRPITPRFFVVGDQVQLEAAIHNNTTEAHPVTIRLQAEGTGLDITGETTVTRTVPAGSLTKVTWPTHVPAGEEVTLLFQAIATDGSGLQDAVRLTLPVYHLTTPEVVATAGIVKAGAGPAVESVLLPQGVDPTDGELRIELNPSLAAGMKKGLHYLKTFPYECVEQTVSKFLPNVVTYRAVTKLGVERPDLEADLRENVAVEIQKLYRFQHTDGGWGWWQGDDSNAWLTAYALLGLVEAKKGEFAVDEAVTERAVHYLRTDLGRSTDVQNPTNANTRAFVLYVLAEAGDGDTGRTVALYEQRESLGLYGRALLAMTLQRLFPDDSSRPQTLLSDITGRAILSATGAHWEEDRQDYWTMNTNTRSTAMVLMALARIEPDNMLLPSAVRWLMVARKEGHWETTQETTWSVLALTGVMVATGELDADFSYQVDLNGKTLAQETATRDNVDRPVTVEVAVKDLLLDQANRLVIARRAPEANQTGKGRLYYAAWLRYFLPAEKVPALERGIAVARQYIAVDPATLEPTGVPVGEAKVGDVVQVKLTVMAPSDLHYVMVEDPLPAGFEAVDTSLLTTSSAAQGPEVKKQQSKVQWWKYWTRAVVRDEKVALFSTYLQRGTYEYTYLMRATTVGRFQARPTVASEMYFPEVFGRSAGGEFVVK